MRWAWDHETIALFRRLDRDLWETTGHNPVWMLGLMSQEESASSQRRSCIYGELDRSLRIIRRVYESTKIRGTEDTTANSKSRPSPTFRWNSALPNACKVIPAVWVF